MNKAALIASVLLSGIFGGSNVMADEFRPAMLDIRESETGLYSVLWKVPMSGNRVLAIEPVFPDFFEQVGPAAVRTFEGSAIRESAWRATDGSLVGETIRIDGLTSIPVNVIIQIDLADGSEHSAILRPSAPAYVVPERATKWAVAGSYWKMGTIHILEGFDHLLFILALMLIVPNYWLLFKTVTAFTVAHSISLAMATLGFVNMPSAPTEAVISLSILFLAVEIIRSRQGTISLTEQYPWMVAFAFGLFHGLGFAGALAEVGLPQDDIPIALLMFNVGVETGQLMFVGAVLLLLTPLRQLPVNWPAGTWRLAPYAIGSIAAYWTIERIGTFMIG